MPNGNVIRLDLDVCPFVDADIFYRSDYVGTVRFTLDPETICLKVVRDQGVTIEGIKFSIVPIDSKDLKEGR